MGLSLMSSHGPPEDRKTVGQQLPKRRLHYRAGIPEVPFKEKHPALPGKRRVFYSTSAGSPNQSRICLVSATTFEMASLVRSPLLKASLTLTVPSTHIMTVTSAFSLIL